MKKLLLFASAAAVCTSALLSCNDGGPDPTPAPAPEVTVAAGEASPTSLSFTVSPTNAAEVAYTVVPAAAETPSARTVLSEGTPGDPDTEKVYTVSGLDPETEYLVVAAARREGLYSEVSAARMTTLPADVPEPEKPTVELTAGQPEANSLTFIVSPSENADRLAWVCVPKGTAVPDAGELLAKGTQVEPAAETTLAADGLEPQTRYVIAAVAAAGTALSDVATLEMTTSEGEWPGYDEEIVCPTAAGGYIGNTITHSSNGQFSLNLTDCEVDENGHLLSGGRQFLLSLHSDLFDDPAAAAPAPGTYTLDPQNTYDKFTVDYKHSSYTEINGDFYVADEGMISACTLTLEQEADGGYSVSAIVRVRSVNIDKFFKLSYSGPIVWKDNTVDPPVDYDMEATYAVMVFVGAPDDNPDVHEWHLQLFDKMPDETKQIMTVSFLTPAVADWRHPVLPEGTFTLGRFERSEPWVFHPGDALFGMDYGTYFQAVTDKGYVVVSHCNGGLFTITRNGDRYTFDCDFTTTVNTKITTRYTGSYELVANSYTGPIDRNLDVTLDTVEPTSAHFSNYGSNDYNMRLADYGTDEYFQPVRPLGREYNMLDLLLTVAAPTPPEYYLPDGTYPIVEGGGPGTAPQQYVMAYWWDDEGFRHRSKFQSGSVEVVRTHDKFYDIRMKAKTDSGYDYECRFTGELDFILYLKDNAPAPYSRKAAVPQRPQPDGMLVRLQPVVRR